MIMMSFIEGGTRNPPLPHIISPQNRKPLTDEI
jgi:hypothetical protein